MAEPKTLQELMRIMDVASTLRREREAASAQLDFDETKALLRKKLRATAEVTGEKVTEAEIEAAIDHYYRTLYRYADPPKSWKVWLAHLYVRRWKIALWTAIAVAVGTLIWWLFLSAAGPFSAEGQRRREAAHQLEQQDLRARRAAAEAAVRERAARDAQARQVQELATLSERIVAEHAAVVALAQEPAARAEADAALARFEELGAPTAEALGALLSELRGLRLELDEAYEIRIVSRGGERSGFIGYVGDTQQVSGYYLVVEAVTDQGRRLVRQIRDGETGESVPTRKWGEQVPKAVFDRVAADKREDGVVDDLLFARKRRGYRGEEVVIVGDDGAPISRGRRVTGDM